MADSKLDYNQFIQDQVEVESEEEIKKYIFIGDLLSFKTLK